MRSFAFHCVQRDGDEATPLLKENGTHARVNDPRNSAFTRARFPCQIIRRARPHPRSLPLGPFVAETRKVRLRESESGRLENLERASFVPPTIFHSGYHIVYTNTLESLYELP